MVTVPRSVKETPPWVWFLAVLIAGVGLVVAHHWYMTSPDEESWLDADQPALNLDAVAEAIPQYRAKRRPYPGTLMDWPCSKVGDC